MRDHGGDLDRARAAFGGNDWIDLSTGINPSPYPLPPIAAQAWSALPTDRDIASLADAARNCYETNLDVVPLGGAQAAIQLVPRISGPGSARIVGPTYNEHAAALSLAGWSVGEVGEPAALHGAGLGVVVNPNNPDGRSFAPGQLMETSTQLGLLVVDESFADPHPENSLARCGDLPDNVVLLRSFGKFYGLAGLRLGFALSKPKLAARIRELAGPWAVSGPAVSVGSTALGNAAWGSETRERLQADTMRLDRIAGRAGWKLVGGTHLFRTYDTDDAAAVQRQLARARIWTRIFPYARGWIRLGLPGPTSHWDRLEDALSSGVE